MENITSRDLVTALIVCYQNMAQELSLLLATDIEYLCVLSNIDERLAAERNRINLIESQLKERGF